jgi:hypothetical protein
MAHTRLYFELSGNSPYNGEAWRSRLAAWSARGSGGVTLASGPKEADWIIETRSAQHFLGGRVFTLPSDSHYHRHPDRTVVWDGSDFPTGFLRGLYCSLPRGLFDSERHRSFCYPFRYNPYIEELPLDDATHLFGFVGEITSGLRARIFSTLSGPSPHGTALLLRKPSLFQQMAARESEAPMRDYVEALRRCRFFLCPRGNGVSSVRLFETMEAARVPVILSDALVLPQCVDWSSCAVIVRERDLPRLPGILAARLADWPALARNARREWERNFSDTVMLETVARELAVLAAMPRHGPVATRLRYLRGVVPAFATSQLKSGVRWLQQLRSRFRPRVP